MALSKKEETRVSARVFSCLSLIVAVVLVAVGVVCCKAGAGMVSMVNEGLVEQKIYFPPANPAMFPDVAEYAEQQVDDGEKAKLYADGVLGAQLKLIGNGKTLSEVSAGLAADPQNMGLQQVQATMFQLETSRGMMLADSYGTWMQGKMMKNLGVVLLVAGAALLLVSGLQYMRYKKS